MKRIWTVLNFYSINNRKGQWSLIVCCIVVWPSSPTAWNLIEWWDRIRILGLTQFPINNVARFDVWHWWTGPVDSSVRLRKIRNKINNNWISCWQLLLSLIRHCFTAINFGLFLMKSFWPFCWNFFSSSFVDVYIFIWFRNCEMLEEYQPKIKSCKSLLKKATT